MKKILFLLLLSIVMYPMTSFAIGETMPSISTVTPQTSTSLDEVITITGEGFNSGNNRGLVCDDLRNSLGLKVINWTDTSVQFSFDKNDWHYLIYAKNNGSVK